MYHQASVLQGHQLHLWPWLALPPIPAAPFVSHWSLNARAYTCHHQQSQEVSWDKLGHGNPVISKLRLEQKIRRLLEKNSNSTNSGPLTPFFSAHLGCTEAARHRTLRKLTKEYTQNRLFPKQCIPWECLICNGMDEFSFLRRRHRHFCKDLFKMIQLKSLTWHRRQAQRK